ncbi:MAG: hypothetical protein HQ539_03585, partial [Parcubacteria group bacterium]|nr:hypothetical protein [Parcubacteria group bacterium]
LMTYIRPKVAQIMFELIDKELDRGSRADCDVDEVFKRSGGKDECCGSYKKGEEIVSYCNLVGEKPPALNELLTYLNTKTPLTALSDMGDKVLFDFNANGEYTDIKPQTDAIAKLLSTPIESLIFSQANNRTGLVQPMIKTICDGTLEFELSTIDSEENPDGLIAINNENWCTSNLNIGNKEKFKAFLKKTPTEFIKEKFKYPIVDCSDKEKCEWTKIGSIMDWLAGTDEKPGRYPFLKEKYIDTLGGLGNDWLNGVLFDAKDDVVGSQKLIDKSITNAQDKVVGVLNKNLIERPAQFVMGISNGIANLISGKAGDNLADQLTGTCREVYTSTACNESEIYRSATELEPAQCCSLGKNVVCTPRCRERGNSGCHEEIGEVDTGGECCFDLNETQDSCKVYRMIPAIDDSENRGCREGEKKGKMEVNGQEIMGCYKLNPNPPLRPRIYETDEELGEISVDGESVILPQTDKCCTTVVDCVADQFGEHLKVLGDMMGDGVLPLNRLGQRRDEIQ